MPHKIPLRIEKDDEKAIVIYDQKTGRVTTISEESEIIKCLTEKNRYYEFILPSGKKAAQKMFYFFERKGIDLNLRYGIHYYGSYSAKLDNTLHILESEDYIDINTSSSTHVTSMKEGVPADALSEAQKQIAVTVIKEFAHKTPLELEALATMDFVSNTMKCSTKEQIVNTFREIKGNKFSESIIEESYRSLQEFGLIEVA